MTAFYRRLLERVQALPGITAVSASTGMPLQGTSFGMPFDIVGKPVADRSQRPGAGFNMVTPGFFTTFGIRISRGRSFTEADVAGGLPVAVVNSTFVKRYFPNVDPFTQRISVEQLIPGVTNLGPPIDWQIVGIYENVRNGGPKGNGFPEIDVPFAQSPWPRVRMAVRTAGNPDSLNKSIAAVIHSADPDLPMADLKTMDQLFQESLGGDRFGAFLFGGFALIALCLATFGIYGVMSFGVAQRTHEIGLRMALGARQTQVLGLILKEGMTLGFIGLFYWARRLVRDWAAHARDVVWHRLARSNRLQRCGGGADVVGLAGLLHSCTQGDAGRSDGRIAPRLTRQDCPLATSRTGSPHPAVDGYVAPNLLKRDVGTEFNRTDDGVSARNF
jgi:putative ABC transport system permease protein